MKRAVLTTVALTAILTLGSAFADAKPTPVVVDSKGKELGPLAYSASVQQGVVLNVSGKINGVVGSLWVLVPFGPNGTGYELTPTSYLATVLPDRPT